MIISIVNHKGGTGKTTTTINLGSALVKQGQKVLVIDFDAQGSLSYSLGIDDSQPTISDILLEQVPFEEIVTEREGMDVLPANKALADVELSIARSADRFGHLRELVHYFNNYDFVLIDCPPSFSLLTLNALVASERIIVPMQLDVLALRGLDSIIDTVAKIQVLNPSLAILGILPVMVDARKNIHHEIRNHIQANYDTRIFRQSIRSCVKATEAPSFGKSVIQYAPACSTSIDYMAFATELLKLEKTEKSQLKYSEV